MQNTNNSNDRKQIYLRLSKEVRLALKLLGIAYEETMTETVSRLILKAYQEQKIALPKGKMSKIKKLVKKWS